METVQARIQLGGIVGEALQHGDSGRLSSIAIELASRRHLLRGKGELRGLGYLLDDNTGLGLLDSIVSSENVVQLPLLKSL